MQKWEYKSVYRTRVFKGSFTGLNEADDWSHNIPAYLPKLGEEGWELIAVVPRSGFAGQNYSGFDSEEMWVFKRPIE